MCRIISKWGLNDVFVCFVFTYFLFCLFLYRFGEEELLKHKAVVENMVSLLALNRVGAKNNLNDGMSFT
jgi:hypothetical protein